LEEANADVTRLYWRFHVRDGAALHHLFVGEHQRPDLSQDYRENQQIRADKYDE